jgi:recombinational DNA repair protein (RecF pathway)
MKIYLVFFSGHIGESDNNYVVRAWFPQAALNKVFKSEGIELDLSQCETEDDGITYLYIESSEVVARMHWACYELDFAKSDVLNI